MPTFDVECKVCKVVYEVLVKLNSPIDPCPICKGPREKLTPLPGVLLKGPGFHVNDYPSADRIVGEKAEEAWKAVYERNKVKRELSAVGDVFSMPDTHLPTYHLKSKGSKDSHIKKVVEKSKESFCEDLRKV